MALTVLDVLGYLDEIPICVGYEIDGEVVKDFPVTYKAGEGKTGSEETSGLEMRYPRNQEIRRSPGRVPQLHRDDRGRAWRTGNHGIQWSGT